MKEDMSTAHSYKMERRSPGLTELILHKKNYSYSNGNRLERKTLKPKVALASHRPQHAKEANLLSNQTPVQAAETCC